MVYDSCTMYLDWTTNYCTYLVHPTENDRNEVTEMALAGTLGTSGDVLAALVVVPVVVTVAGILVVLLIFGVLLYKRRNKPSRPVPDVLLKKRCYHAGTCYWINYFAQQILNSHHFVCTNPRLLQNNSDFLLTLSPSLNQVLNDSVGIW